jgi:hypothetical protein
MAASFDDLDYITGAWENRQNEISNRNISDNRHIVERELHDDEDDDNAYSLEAFRQKLDDLTESLENNFNLENLLIEAKSSTTVKKLTPLQRHTSGNSSYMDDDHHVETTPQLPRLRSRAEAGQGSNHSAMPTSNTSRVATTPEPPTPVKTPLRDDPFISMPPDRIHRTASGLEQSRERLYGAASESNFSQGVATGDRDLQDLKVLVESMRDSFSRQEERIRNLERENDILRLRLHQPQQDQRQSHSVPMGVRHRHTSSRSVVYSDLNDRISPGTRFVVELAQVMNLPEEQYEPLSRIMDRQLDRLVESRRRLNWDEIRR